MSPIFNGTLMVIPGYVWRRSILLNRATHSQSFPNRLSRESCGLMKQGFHLILSVLGYSILVRSSFAGSRGEAAGSEMAFGLRTTIAAKITRNMIRLNFFSMFFPGKRGFVFRFRNIFYYQGQVKGNCADETPGGRTVAINCRRSRSSLRDAGINGQIIL